MKKFGIIALVLILLFGINGVIDIATHFIRGAVILVGIFLIAAFIRALFVVSNSSNGKSVEENSIAYYNRGNSYAQSGQNERAIQDFNKAIELNPNMYHAYHNRGLIYAQSGNFNQAIADFTKAIQLNTNNAITYYTRGICYQELGENAKAQADLKKAKELGYNG